MYHGPNLPNALWLDELRYQRQSAQKSHNSSEFFSEATLLFVLFDRDKSEEGA